ncbi:MAG: PIN domain-containing protein [Planctomycetaceae bacterium]|nr:PIN domain-containing protein [Planctomycetaceae bacterium]
MGDKVFFDTNVLVYAYDQRDPNKQSQAQALLLKATQSQTAVLSAQVLGEFFVVVTRKIPQPMTSSEAAEVIAELGAMDVMPLDLSLVQRAIATQQTYGVSYWDSLIIAAAERAGCVRIFSEDLNSGQLYHGVEVQNPFPPPVGK